MTVTCFNLNTELISVLAVRQAQRFRCSKEQIVELFKGIGGLESMCALRRVKDTTVMQIRLGYKCTLQRFRY